MGKTNLKKTQESTIADWTEANEVLRKIAIQTFNINRLRADMNERIANIEAEYTQEIDVKTIEKISLETNLKLFCEGRRDDFGDKKTKELHFGAVSFRYSTPALRTLKGFTWESVKQLLKNSKRYADEFLRTKIDIDKNAIISAELKPNELAKIGVQISQEENFAYECFERN